MAIVASSQPNKILKFFSLKLYKIRVRPLDFLGQNLEPFTTPMTDTRGPLVSSPCSMGPASWASFTLVVGPRNSFFEVPVVRNRRYYHNKIGS